MKLTKGPMAGKTIVFARQDRIGEHREQVAALLSALGHPEAFVTDISSVGDFCLEADELAAAATTLGFAVNHGDLLVDLADMMARPVQ